jgi:hypothetical protein
MPDTRVRPRRVIFLNRFGWPEEPATAQLLADLSGALAAAGHEVTVITSRPRTGTLPLREVHAGVLILRVKSTRWARFGLPGKATDFLTFYFGALGRLLFTAGRGDAVVALTDPPLLGIGTWLAARLCGARIFHWVQDVYPEIAIVLTGHRWLKIVEPLRNLAWRRSDGCVTLGSDMAGTLSRAGVAAEKIHLCPNWAPAGLTVQPRHAADSLRTAWRLEGKFVVAYSGNLGRVHDLGPVLAVAETLRAESGIVFVFIGGGAQRGQLESQAVERGLTNVRFFPAQPRERLAETLALGDVHLVTLLSGCEDLVFPSKLYGVATVGRPVVFIGPRECEIARLVTERGLGQAFSRDETALLASVLRELQTNPGRLAQFGTAASAFGREHAGPGTALKVWESLLATDK